MAGRAYARLGRLALHVLWPQTCAHCRRDLGFEGGAALCRGCLESLEPLLRPYCLRCALPLTGAAPLCPRCRGRSPALKMVRALFVYSGPLPGLVHAFKYGGDRQAARQAGEWMGRRLQDFPELLSGGSPPSLVPVPLHRKRLARRGFNQARLLAESLSRACGLPMLDILLRSKETPPLWGLGRRERYQRVAGAFGTVPGAPVRGRRFILVDDVCTSGASLESCAGALRRAGASGCAGYVLAREV